LEDISARALRLLQEVPLIAAEDTRRTQALLSHFGISNKITSFFEYTNPKKTQWLIHHLMNGHDLALVSDAGTPTVSDPGVRLIAMAHQEGISVIPIPGASALIALLSVSGFPSEPIHFWGFLSPKNSKRKKIYDHILNMEGAHCFYDSPHKIKKHLDEWEQYLGDCYFCVGREMTKKFETYYRGKLAQIREALLEEGSRGELSVVVTKELL
jgi:16S rRNA (cytidine1402-2'-O)-methyltransferase